MGSAVHESMKTTGHKHVCLKGLAERRQRRIEERNRCKGVVLRSGKVPKGEQREIRMMQVFFATLPHDQLRAAYTAVKKALEQQKPKITK